MAIARPLEHFPQWMHSDHVPASNAGHGAPSTDSSFSAESRFGAEDSAASRADSEDTSTCVSSEDLGDTNVLPLLRVSDDSGLFEEGAQASWYLMLMGYVGKGYSGFQKSQIPGDFETIEGNLLSAMKKIGVSSSEIEKAGTNMSSRTDKGVHAANLFYQFKTRPLRDEDKFINALNHSLSSQGDHAVRVFNIVNAKDLGLRPDFDVKASDLCQSRSYWYLVPSFAMAPVPSHATTCDTSMRKHMRSFRMSQKQLADVEELLNRFLGEHCFSAFTAREKVQYYKQRKFGTSAQVYTVQCSIKEQFGVEFLQVQFVASRYLYHQIRNMMGFALLVFHGRLDRDSNFNAVFEGGALPSKVEIPLAPAEPLLLLRPTFRDNIPAGSILNQMLENKQSEAFLHNTILPHVCRASVEPIVHFMTSLLQSTVRWLGRQHSVTGTKA
mmetsp:Transcript_4189/g.6603  ORF Transcript_4189/g.6603 Transcript_4189/m.6603 type:complete len:440 (+) Transcript_4189:988-2307(+)